MSVSTVTPALANIDSYLFNNTKCHGNIQMMKFTMMLKKRCQTHFKASMLMLGMGILFLVLSNLILNAGCILLCSNNCHFGGNCLFFISMCTLTRVKIIKRKRRIALFSINCIKRQVSVCDGVMVCLWLCARIYLWTQINPETSVPVQHWTHQAICDNMW